MTLAYHHFEGSLPPYLSSSLQTYKLSHPLWSSGEKLLNIPKQNLKSFGEHSFSFLAPSVCSHCWPLSETYQHCLSNSSVNCVCVWLTKKLTMLAYCVAVNCNDSLTTPGITMHELPHNRPAVRRKWIKFIQCKRADFLAVPHHTHLRSEHFSECDFANPMEYCIGFASKLTQCSGTLSKSCLTGSNWYGCILVGLSGKVSVSSSELKLAILQWLPRVT